MAQHSDGVLGFELPFILVSIADAALQEYSQMPFLLGRPILKDILASCMAYARGEYKGMTASELDSGRAGRGSELFISGHQPYHQAGSSL